jgi:nucleoside 2-deoxyribosyltransferase
MIYLAVPYSDPDASIREQRFHAACVAAARLMRAGCFVHSPISHGHPIAAHGVPTDWQFWEAHDRRFLEQCDVVVVLMLDGWQESRGVQAEIQIANELGKPVRYLAPGGEGATTSAHVAKEAER